MKIRKPTTHMVDIGPLDAAIRLPMASRIAAGMRTICDACGQHITDATFVAGFKAGHPNLKLHESCAAESGCEVTSNA